MLTGRTLNVAGLFAGVGGIEIGLTRAGHKGVQLCEIDAAAQAVLRARFGNIPLTPDVREVELLPNVDLVAAGFPCQDLSQAGRTAGINGNHSGLVDWVFRLLRQSSRRPEWVLLENVPFMLHLNRGVALRYLIDQLEGLGYMWAYRTVDTRAFGLPHRRRRVLILASLNDDPRPVLLGDDAGEPEPRQDDGLCCGFYWTEGNRGLGWAVDATPPLKGSSGLGIPAPPGIWLPRERAIVTPDIRDAERLQGFETDWTLPALSCQRGGRHVRWRLVGNAVSVPVARWIGEGLNESRPYDDYCDERLTRSAWPASGWGRNGHIHATSRSNWPVQVQQQSLVDFLQFPTQFLSARATSGFLNRLRRSKLRVPEQFLCDLAFHEERMSSCKGTIGEKQKV